MSALDWLAVAGLACLAIGLPWLWWECRHAPLDPDDASPFADRDGPQDPWRDERIIALDTLAREAQARGEYDAPEAA